MSENNQTRFEKECVICKTRNAQRFSNFCEICLTEKRAEALEFIGMEDNAVDHRVDTMRRESRGW